jgi:hypothetical protein
MRAKAESWKNSFKMAENSPILAETKHKPTNSRNGTNTRQDKVIDQGQDIS